MANGYKTGGRQKGTPNKSTQEVRDAISLLAQRKAPMLEEWLDRVAENDPAKAADLFLRAIEYHIPKLGRTEVVGDEDGGPVKVSFTWKAK
jgi:hypothetical protein